MKKHLQEPHPQIDDNIRQDILRLFADSVGMEFRIRTTPLTDIIDGVEMSKCMIVGRKYGSFHVDICELTGGLKIKKES